MDIDDTKTAPDLRKVILFSKIFVELTLRSTGCKVTGRRYVFHVMLYITKWLRPASAPAPDLCMHFNVELYHTRRVHPEMDDKYVCGNYLSYFERNNQ
ncbi:hypothetical protein PG988_013287 [Apiospora saccharicola]